MIDYNSSDCETKHSLLPLISPSSVLSQQSGAELIEQENQVTTSFRRTVHCLSSTSPFSLAFEVHLGKRKPGNVSSQHAEGISSKERKKQSKITIANGQ